MKINQNNNNLCVYKLKYKKVPVFFKKLVNFIKSIGTFKDLFAVIIPIQLCKHIQRVVKTFLINFPANKTLRKVSVETLTIYRAVSLKIQKIRDPTQFAIIILIES